jgi:hypothetical protein
MDLFPLVKKNMKRLTLDELKAQKSQKNIVAQLEAIKGGTLDSCHDAGLKNMGKPITTTTPQSCHKK